MTDGNKAIFSAMYDTATEPFEIMVHQGNGYWSLQTVIGKSMSGLLIFSGWFVSSIFDVKEYMTIEDYNLKKPSKHHLNIQDYKDNKEIKRKNYTNMRS